MKAKSIVFVIAGVILVAVVSLVMYNSCGTGCFRHNAEKWAQPTIDQTNVITNNQLEKLSGNSLRIDLNEKENLLKVDKGSINIPASVILEKENLKKLRAHEGNIVLISADHALSARIWMLLSQMGFKNLFILDDSAGNDFLKYKFQPDTIIRLES